MTGSEHWTHKIDNGEKVRLYLFNKVAGDPKKTRGTVLLVHGSSMASTPTFDLQVPGRSDSSVMDVLARAGYDVWCVDMEGYGKSEKGRNNNAGISQGADDCLAAATDIRKLRGPRKLLPYGISSGALRAALFAQRNPDLVARLALDAMVWTGEGSPTLEQRAKRLDEFRARNRRPIDRAFVRSIFSRDHPGCAEEKVVEAFADAILALDDSIPNGTYVDMCSKLPVVDPAKITMPTILMRGQWDGIAGLDDLLEFYKRLPNPDKTFSMMAGISHASFQQINYLMVYHIRPGRGTASSVGQNRRAMLALTAPYQNDNYTFTHMVNVSVLTMAQAHSLGIDGPALRQFGMAGLMPDIGKVRTPAEILRKPDRLPDSEMSVMRRHVVDGAEILRRTPEIPSIAPVVAFEHHLRSDGTGYPVGVSRPKLNLATMLCSIADVYDAMRSQRAYQGSLPTERILEVMKRADGHQFDQHLVRRFTQLLGIYPPGNLVLLDDGAIAVVLQVHAPDPHRPACG